jgi:hypothetical protein
MPAPKRGFALLLVVAALPGCGGSDDDSQPNGRVGGDQRDILETVDALQSSSRRGDGRTICAELFTPALKRSIRRASRGSCAAEVRKRLFRPNASISVRRPIAVQGSTAAAVIREENGEVSTLQMVKRAGRWRINRVKRGGS